MKSPTTAVQQIGTEGSFKLETGTIGLQLVATRIIPRNELIISVYYRPAESQTSHTFQVDDNKHVTGPIVEYINHSCDPNCGLVVDTECGVLRIISRKDIDIGETLTIDYCAFENSIKHMPDSCLCGSKHCRGTVTGFSDLSMEDRERYKPFIPDYIKRTHSIEDISPIAELSISQTEIAYDPVANRITSKNPIFVKDTKHLSSYLLQALRLSNSVDATRITIRLLMQKSFLTYPTRLLLKNNFII